jgi:alkyl sulfatase BDS1-like metallo-beta-lactamase superfamily hydrolase
MTQSDDFRLVIGRSEFPRGIASAGIVAGLAAATSASAQDIPPAPTGTVPKPATRFTKEVNALYRQWLPFDNTADFEDARRGLIGSLPEPVTISDEKGVPV